MTRLRTASLRPLAASACALAALGGVIAGAGPAAAAPPSSPATAAAPAAAAASTPGTVVSWADLSADDDAMMAGAAHAFSLVYATTDASGAPRTARATAWIPTAAAPAGGRRVLAYGHGTAGVGDACAETYRYGRDSGRGEWFAPTFAPWFERGYLVVATEYSGIGTDGEHAYLDGAAAAHDLIDAVRAARTVAAQHFGQEVSTKYVTDGSSQGGHAAMWSATVAGEYAPELRMLGASAVAPPAYVQDSLHLLGPLTPALPAEYTAYLLYLLHGVEAGRPGVDVRGYLTPAGAKLYDAAATQCYSDLTATAKGVRIGSLLAKPLRSGALLPAFTAMSDIPVRGYDAPVLVQQGLFDLTSLWAQTAVKVTAARRNGATIDLRTSAGTHRVGPEVEVAAARWADTLK